MEILKEQWWNLSECDYNVNMFSVNMAILGRIVEFSSRVVNFLCRAHIIDW